MRSHALRPWAFLPADTKRFVLLIAGAWIGGLAIFLLLGIALPATSASQGADRASPSSDVGVATAGFHPSQQSLGPEVKVSASVDATPSSPVQLAGHRWLPATVSSPVELAGHRWLPATPSSPVQLAGHRWSPATVSSPSRV